MQWMEKHRPKDEELRRFRAEAENLLKPQPTRRDPQSSKKENQVSRTG
jgi:hypothetical protein